MMQDFVQQSDVTQSANMKEVSEWFLAAFNKQKLQKEYSEEERRNKDNKLKDIAYKIDRHYGNPSKFSVDLVRQAKYLCAIGTHMLKARWQYPYDLVEGIRQYKDYLCMMKDIQHWVGDPPLTIHLAWHVHMMHPQRYQTFTTKNVGRLLEHLDDGFCYQSFSKNRQSAINVFINGGSSTTLQAMIASSLL
ncbi:hypothetical protein BC941DRAFT_42750 [Chlamydoabsidia padenii]|nr:hypothetical protein BC941DRAFT_42750 [Chlamydoabsidia padenii]